MPPGAAELAVGDGVETDVLLKPDGVADRRVLDFGERLGGNLATLAPLARVQQLLRAQQTADMVGAKRGLGARADGFLPIVAAILVGTSMQAPRTARPDVGPLDCILYKIDNLAKNCPS